MTRLLTNEVNLDTASVACSSTHDVQRTQEKLTEAILANSRGRPTIERLKALHNYYYRLAVNLPHRLAALGPGISQLPPERARMSIVAVIPSILLASLKAVSM